MRADERGGAASDPERVQARLRLVVGLAIGAFAVGATLLIARCGRGAGAGGAWAGDGAAVNDEDDGAAATGDGRRDAGQLAPERCAEVVGEAPLVEEV